MAEAILRDIARLFSLRNVNHSLIPGRDRARDFNSPAGSVMRVRFLAIVGLGAIFLWMSVGAPVPQLSVASMKPDARIPTFEQSRADQVELEQAVRGGRLVESPRQHALRATVLQAGERVE